MLSIIHQFLLPCTLLLLGNASPQPATPQPQPTPTVFLIEENTALFEQLSLRHDSLLITACGNDFNLAYQRWRDMLLEMEATARKLKYDINGVKMWLKVFWNEKGEISYIAFSLKPTSRSVDLQLFIRYLEYFRRKYKSPTRTPYRYSHYASVSFPAF